MAAKKVKLITFSTKTGPPKGAEDTYIFDVSESVRNPWRFKELRKLDGRDPAVKSVLENCSKSRNLIRSTAATIASCAYYERHSWNLAHTDEVTLYIGCKRGRWQSVAFAELLKTEILEIWDGSDDELNPLVMVEIKHTALEDK